MSDDTADHGPDFINGAVPKLRGGIEPGDRVVGLALTVRSEEGELRTMAAIPGEDELRCVVFTDEEAVDDALVAWTVNAIPDLGCGE